MEWLGKGWNMFSRGGGRERDGGRDGKVRVYREVEGVG
jgi:hypothetical protein